MSSPVTARPKTSHVRWTVCALLFFATTINYVDRQVLSILAKTLETTETDLMHTVFPHPTVSETMHEAVLGAYGRAIHF